MKSSAAKVVKIDSSNEKSASENRLAQVHKIRANRLTGISNFLDLKVTTGDGVEGKLVNLSETGLAFSTTKPVGSPGSSIELTIAVDGQNQIYHGPVELAWVREQEQGYLVGARFTSYVLSEALPRGLEATGGIYQEVEKLRTTVETLSPEFRSFVLEFRVYLRSLKSRLDDLERKLGASSLEVKRSYRRAVELWVAPKAIEQIKIYNARLFKIMNGFKNREERNAAILVFREELNEYLAFSPFTERALTKPRGYAGDYEMMNQIYRDEFEGDSFFNQIIHKYSISEASSQSVRYRKELLMKRFRETLAKTKGRAVFGSLACGPAREVIDFLKTESPETIVRCTFILIDQDSEALINCQRNIYQIILERGLQCDVQYIPLSVKDVLERSIPVRQIEGIKFDYLYTAGLYDYLSQPLARAITQELLEYVTDDGTLLIGNFHPANPTKAISEFSVDWRLVHRTEEEMWDLVPATLKKNAELMMDDQKIDLFLEIKK